MFYKQVLFIYIFIIIKKKYYNKLDNYNKLDDNC